MGAVFFCPGNISTSVKLTGPVMFSLLSLQDVDRITHLLDDRDILRNLKSLTDPYPREAAVTFVNQVRRQKEGLPAMTGVRVAGKSTWALRVERQLAGVLGFRIGSGAEQGDFTLGYWLGRDYWGQGLATRAVHQACRWAFELAGARRVSAHVFSWNPASARVLHKNGFQREGCKRRGITRFGEVADLWNYGLLPEDFVSPLQIT